MPYNLYVITPSGKVRESLRSPYPTREETAVTVRMVVRADLAVDAALADAVADKVTAAPLGETVTHEGTPLAFRTEEI